MVTYKKIVVPTDGSENAKRALEHAIAVADRNEAELIIVHVANIVSAISFASGCFVCKSSKNSFINSLVLALHAPHNSVPFLHSSWILLNSSSESNK